MQKRFLAYSTAIIATFMIFVTAAFAGQSIKFGPVVPEEVAENGETAIDQTIPETSIENKVATLNITSPTTTRFGWGITEAAAGTAAEPANEPDHTMGTYYNRTGVNGGLINQFEHSWNRKAETNFRSTAATGDKTWVEWNTNIWPADNSSVVTSWNATAFVAEEAITFDGGATGKVLSWDGTTLVFRMDGGGDTANAEVVTAAGSGAEATLANVTAFTGNNYRPYLEIYRTMDNRSQFSWGTRPDETDIFVIRSGGVGINWASGVNNNFVVRSKLGASSNPALQVRYQSLGYDGTGDGNIINLGIMTEVDYRGENMVFFLGSVLKIGEPIGPAGTGSTVVEPSAFVITNQEGYDQSNDPVIYIHSQDCRAGGGASACVNGKSGNIALAGGDWNTGHLVLGHKGNLGSHLWHEQATDRLWMNTNNFAPTSAKNGTAGVMLAGHTGLDTHAISYQAISNGSTFNTGDEVCAQPALTCVANGVWDLVDATVRACTDEITNGEMFTVMCK